MNILIVSFSINGAMGDNFKLIAKYLSLNNNTFILTNKNINSKDVGTSQIKNINFDRKKPLTFINPLSFFKIHKYIKETQFDIAFILSPHPINIFLYHIINNAKIVTYVHDHIPHSGVKKLDYFFMKKQLNYFYNRSKKIIVSCNWIKKDILEKKFISNSSKIEVNYLGLLENHLYPNNKIKEDIDVLFFGRIEYYKGLDILIKAAQNLNQYKFYIVGKGNINSTFGIDQIPSNCIHINNYIPDEELAKYIQRSKIVVLPYRDATGTQTIQSIFYYKKPIIATNVGCFPEYISNEKDGIIIKKESIEELTDAIKLLLTDKEKRLSYGNNGYNKISSIFNNENIAKKYIQIFELITYEN